MYTAKIDLIKNVQILSDTVYIDPLNIHADIPMDEFEDEGDKYAEGNKREKRKLPDKSTEVSRKYEVIGTVLDRRVIFLNSTKVFKFHFVSFKRRGLLFFEIIEFAFIRCFFLTITRILYFYF